MSEDKKTDYEVKCINKPLTVTSFLQWSLRQPSPGGWRLQRGTTVCCLTWLPAAALRLRCSNWKIASDLICINGLDKLAAKAEKAALVRFLGTLGPPVSLLLQEVIKSRQRGLHSSASQAGCEEGIHHVKPPDTGLATDFDRLWTSLWQKAANEG